jgi:cytochrome P450
MTTHEVIDAGEIADILSSSAVAPPTRSGDGATLELRRAMARFSSPDDHPARRTGVERAIADVDIGVAAQAAGRAARRQLDSAAVRDAMTIAHSAPLTGLAAAIGLVDPDDEVAVAAHVGDVDVVTAVIGRGAPSSRAADAAADRLLALAAEHSDPVAVVSMLYQCLDATAALVATGLVAHARVRPRVAAVPRTVRLATHTTTFGGTSVEVGDTLVLELGRADAEFGVGPHACPGRALAERLAEAVIGEIESSGVGIDLDDLVVDDDGRPVTLPLR